MATGEIIIRVESDMTEFVFETLEDDIRNLLESQGIKAEIYDNVTGNITKTRRGMFGKNEGTDRTIRGDLILGDKIWFNDDLRCRLSICGFTRGQIEKLRTAKMVDLTFTDFRDEDMPGVAIDIKGWGEDSEESCE